MSRSIDRVSVALFFVLSASSGAHAARAHLDATVTCNIPQPCALYQNANGIGLSATSAKSEGLYGSTTFPATSASNRTFGVEGVDASTNKNKFNSGLFGSSPYGYGLYASSPNGTAVYATSTSGVGVRAASTSGFAVNAASSSNVAVNAKSSSNTAVLGTTAATSGTYAGLMGVDSSTNGGSNIGVLGVTTNGGYGVEGTSTGAQSGGVYGSAAEGIGVTGISSLIAVSGQGKIAFYGSSDVYPMILTNAGGTDEVYVTGSGNIYARGAYNTLVHTRNGSEAVAFTPRSTSSSLEDTGTAELTGGTATVRFDPTFAASIDARSTYQVFLTPGGDTHGLFVARKTPAGFVVRETEGGRGTLSFDYRIVAAASGHAGDRMAPVSAASEHERRALQNTRALPSSNGLPFLTIPGAK